MITTEAECDRLTEELHRLIADFVDDHPMTRNLRPVAKRNMAYMGATCAVNSLWPDDIELTKRDPT